MNTKAKRRAAERVAAAARVEEARGRGAPRASLALCRDSIRGLDDLPPAVLEAVDEHLGHYAWLEVDGHVVCPGCGTRGRFSWGLTYGAGACACGWPGRLIHAVLDPSPDAPCRHCRQSAAGHDADRRCAARLGHWYEPAAAARLEVLLWAHPDEVSA